MRSTGTSPNVAVEAGRLPLGRRQASRLRRSVAALAGLAIVAAGCTQTGNTLAVTFESSAGANGATVKTFVVDGTASLTGTVSTRSGGSVRLANSRTGGGRALRFPAFGTATDEPRAVLRIQNSGSGDALAPGTADFEFGADFKLDAVSSSSEVGSIDNGDNLVQRGLFDDVGQYKLQIDDRQPSCRIKGSAGAVAAVSPVAVDSTGWYRARCLRTGDTVTVQVFRWASDGSMGTMTSTSATGPIGAVTMKASLPFSVGGKLNASGGVSSATDQFNGWADNIWYRVA